MVFKGHHYKVTLPVGPQCKYLISGNINKDMDVHEYGLNKGMREKNITI